MDETWTLFAEWAKKVEADEGRLHDEWFAAIKAVCGHEDAERLQVESAAEWRAWLEANHERTEGVWLVTFKKGSGRPVVTWDERLSSAQVEREMRQAGLSSRQRRGTVDAAAAAVFLQSYLDAHAQRDENS